MKTYQKIVKEADKIKRNVIFDKPSSSCMKVQQLIITVKEYMGIGWIDELMAADMVLPPLQDARARLEDCVGLEHTQEWASQAVKCAELLKEVSSKLEEYAELHEDC